MCQNGFRSYFLAGAAGVCCPAAVFGAAGVCAVAAGVAGTVSITSTSVTTQLKRSFAHWLSSRRICDMSLVSARMALKNWSIVVYVALTFAAKQL